MKKKIVFSVVAITVVLLNSACDDWLVESPQSFIAPDDFFNTETQSIQATNGVYSHLPGIYGQQDIWGLTFTGTDLFMFNGAGQVFRSFQEYNFSASSATSSYSTWNRAYAAIKDANLVISRLTESPINNEIKARLLGESKYLRALYYFILSNIFGDVPLWADELNVTVVSELPRAPLSEVREQMIRDLQNAAEGLPWKYDSANTGRVTKGAALALLAKVYLYDQDYENAAQTAKRVVEEGPYELLSDYADLFDGQHKNNVESVFEIQFDRDAETNQNYEINYFYTWFFPLRDGNEPTYGGIDFGTTNLESYRQFYPSERLVELYEPEDRRRDIVLGFGYNGEAFTSWPVPGRPWFGPKFWDLEANRRASDKNLYFMRYADVILILAEAQNELGQTADAITLLNKIRNRAGISEFLSALSQHEIRQKIMDERARELVGEFQRKWDLARWDVLVEAVQSIENDNPVGAQNIQPYHKVFPVPFDEIAKNPNLLPQNEGY